MESKWTETTKWSGFSNGGKAIVGQTLVSDEMNKSKRQEITVCDPSRTVNHLSKFEKLWKSSPGLLVPLE